MFTSTGLKVPTMPLIILIFSSVLLVLYLPRPRFIRIEPGVPRMLQKFLNASNMPIVFQKTCALMSQPHNATNLLKIELISSIIWIRKS